jgi:mRNA interferase MazF
VAEKEVLGRRGEIVIVVAPGDYGKPRPALIVQSDLALPLRSVLLCPLTSADNPEASEIRVEITPTDENGLRKPSSVMVDKLMAVSRDRIKSTAGRVRDSEIMEVIRRLAVILGIEEN